MLVDEVLLSIHYEFIILYLFFISIDLLDKLLGEFRISVLCVCEFLCLKVIEFFFLFLPYFCLFIIISFLHCFPFLLLLHLSKEEVFHCQLLHLLLSKLITFAFV